MVLRYYGRCSYFNRADHCLSDTCKIALLNKLFKHYCVLTIFSKWRDILYLKHINPCMEIISNLIRGREARVRGKRLSGRSSVWGEVNVAGLCVKGEIGGERELHSFSHYFTSEIFHITSLN